MVAVLFARRDSVYKSIPGLDVWDEDRDATRWEGGCPGIHHPPCRAWGRLRHMATSTRTGERALAVWSVAMVRLHGGVLEHPAGSTLWRAAGLPRPSEPADVWGGYTISILQWWWSHKAEKATWLYIVGCSKSALPEMPFRIGQAEFVVNTSHGVRKGSPSFRPHCTKSEREATPPQLRRLAGRLGVPLPDSVPGN